MTLRRVSTGVTYATVDLAFAALPATLTQDEILEDIDGTAYTTTTERDITNAGAFTITLRAATAAFSLPTCSAIDTQRRPASVADFFGAS